MQFSSPGICQSSVAFRFPLCKVRMLLFFELNLWPFWGDCFHVFILPRPRPIFRFAFNGQACQYKVLLFWLSLSPRIFTKVLEAAVASLREVGTCLPSYLDNWLILAHSWGLVCTHRNLVLDHLALLGSQVNWKKSKFSPVKSKLSPRMVQLFWSQFSHEQIDLLASQESTHPLLDRGPLGTDTLQRDRARLGSWN